MIKKLRTKFVCTVMVIAMLTVSGILGVVIYFTAENMETQSVSMMRTIASNPFQQGTLGKPPEGIRLPFFIVQISSRGELTATISSYFDLSDLDYIQQIVSTVITSEQETGKLPAHNLRYLKSSSPAGFTIIFADTTTEEATMTNLIYSCLLIFFVAMAVFLGISVLLSQWTIHPVAEAWDQQRQFVADASHELKTPLSVIMANAELMQNEDTGEEDRKKYAGNILSMTYQMRSLVANLLEMARIDNGALDTRFSAVDFSQLVRDAALSFQLLYEEQELGLQSAIAEGLCVQGSEQHLFQVLDVLLDNGLKYSAPHGVVRVNLSQSGRSCLLSVSSPGEPISKEDLKNIFKRFYRADKARTMNGSYGLGLSIAQAVVTNHKGKIWAQSEHGWNTFYVQLPLTQRKNETPENKALA